MSMRVALITLGDPETLTGGYLYHRRLAELAQRFDASVTFVSTAPKVLGAAAGARATLKRAASMGDVVVCDSIVAAPLSIALLRHSGHVVGMLHQGAGGIDGGPIRRLVQRPFDLAAYRRMIHLIVASEQLRRSFLHAGFPDDDITVVAPGRDAPDQRSDNDAPDLRRGSKIAFLCVGNWVARKGIVELLEAWAALPPGLGRLHLVGDDSVDPSYSRVVRRRAASMADTVVMHGPVSRARVDSLYRAADVFVLPSFREPYGTVYGEAMAAGLPVVGWRAGNLPYLIEDGLEGLMSEPADVDGLTRSMEGIARDDELRASMAAAARARGALLPTWDESAAQFFSTLRMVTRQPTQRGDRI
jgi:glycosyltransferase involved in cell wall biosynthesis